MLDDYEYCEQKNFLDQEDQATQLECESYDRLDPGRPKKIVKLVAADVTNRKLGKSTVCWHSTERALA